MIRIHTKYSKILFNLEEIDILKKRNYLLCYFPGHWIVLHVDNRNNSLQIKVKFLASLLTINFLYIDLHFHLENLHLLLFN